VLNSDGKIGLKRKPGRPRKNPSPKVVSPRPKRAKELKEANVLPFAVPVEKREFIETAFCLKSGHKYIAGQWWTFEAGRKLTAPKTVIASLRKAAFVR